MIIKNPEEKEFDKIPNVDENGDPIYNTSPRRLNSYKCFFSHLALVN